MKMNKTRLLEKISIQSGVSLDECGTVFKTFEKVLEMFADTKINCTFALAIRKNSNNKGLIR